MAWEELQPGKAGSEVVRLSRMRGGTAMLSCSAVVAKRCKLVTGAKVRIFADLEANPRRLRMVVDPAGSFGVRITNGGAAVIAVGKLAGLSHIAFERAEVVWDEDTDDKKRPVIDVELPKALQVQAKPPIGASVAITANVAARR